MLLCCCVAGVGYRGALGCALVFDDELAVVRNADTYPEKTPLQTLLHNDFWGAPLSSPQSNKSFRPLTVLSFRLNRLLDNGSPFAFHLANIVLHITATLLLCLYCHALLNESKGTKPQEVDTWCSVLCCGLLFAVHPVHAEAVTGVVGRAELLCFIFSILAAWVMLQKASFLRCVVFLLCALCAVFSKETGIMVVVVVVAVDLCFGRIEWRKVATCVVVVLFYAWVRIVHIGQLDLKGSALLRKTENPVLFAPPLSQYLSLAYIQVKYAMLLLWPTDLCCEYPYNCIPLVESLQDERIVHIVVLFMCVSVVSGICFQQGGMAAAALVWTVVPFLPASGIFFTIGSMVGERLLYIPSAGMCLGVALLARSRVIVCFVVVICFFWADTLHTRNGEWQNHETLFTSALRVCPQSAKHHQQYALLLLNEHNATGALYHLEIALQIDPEYCEPPLYIGKALAMQGVERYPEAQQWWRKCVGCRYVAQQCFDLYYEVQKQYTQGGTPNASAEHELGEALLVMSDYTNAAASFRQAGLARHAEQDWEGAAESFTQAVASWHTANGVDDAGSDLLIEVEDASLNHPCNVWYWLGSVYGQMAMHKSALQTFSKLFFRCPNAPKSVMAAYEGLVAILKEALTNDVVLFRIRMSRIEVVALHAKVLLHMSANEALPLPPAHRDAYKTEGTSLLLKLVASAGAREKCQYITKMVEVLRQGGGAYTTVLCKLLKQQVWKAI